MNVALNLILFKGVVFLSWCCILVGVILCKQVTEIAFVMATFHQRYFTFIHLDEELTRGKRKIGIENCNN